jgi:hypothetical protein
VGDTLRWLGEERVKLFVALVAEQKRIDLSPSKDSREMSDAKATPHHPPANQLQRSESKANGPRRKKKPKQARENQAHSNRQERPQLETQQQKIRQQEIQQPSIQPATPAENPVVENPVAETPVALPTPQGGQA